MSNSAKERDNPPPRRKSCTACIKAKRRCDYVAAPACQRCAHRNITCDYPTHRRAPPPNTTAQRVTSMLSSLAEDRSLSSAAAAEPPLHFDAPATEDDLEALLRSSSSFDMDLGLPLLLPDTDKSNNIHFGGLEGFHMPVDMNTSLVGDVFGVGYHLPEPADDGGSLVDGGGSTPSTEDSSLPELNFLKAAPLQDGGGGGGGSGTLMAPSQQQLYYVSSMIQARLEFAVEVIRTAPRTMVEQLSTPWSHPLLYRTDGDAMPRSIQDALGACALYNTKTTINTPVVFSLIDSHATGLVGSPPPATLRLALAHTHALILYQVMRLFDGDISARARGERLIPALEASTMHLLSFVRFDSELLRVTDLAPYPVQPARELWHDWLLHESARRTVLITFYMLQAYRAMAQPARSAARCAALCHSWTLSRGMWEARSPAEFARVWRDGRWFVVTNRQFGETLREAKAEDVDAFGRMWITALMGVEETEGWFAAKGGSLREKEKDMTAMVC
ncbi:hypothetical protein PWT90_00815 [Aphanocladium album]|nr:hypothetical protein PWT90_00815 [Aphanocladium album]